MKEVKPMDCAQFDQVFHDLDRPGTKGAAARELALAHAESCNRCADLLTQAEWLDFNLLRLKEDALGSEAPPHLESALLQEFRRAKQEWGRRRALRGAAVIGAAAALFIALGLTLKRYEPPHGSASPSGAKLNAPRTIEAPSTPPAASEGSSPAVNSASVAGGADRSSASADTEPAQDATNFVPLPYADDSLVDEGGTIVRVRISPSALASFGLPVMEGEGTEFVQADLVLTADGTPQAIRLVSQSAPAEEF